VNKQTEIPVEPQGVPPYKRDFLRWLDRFSRVSGHIRKVVTEYAFTEEELNKLRPQIEARYKLKAEYAKGLSRGA
jgi:hypothetical protein